MQIRSSDLTPQSNQRCTRKSQTSLATTLTDTLIIHLKPHPHTHCKQLSATHTPKLCQLTQPLQPTLKSTEYTKPTQKPSISSLVAIQLHPKQTLLPQITPPQTNPNAASLYPTSEPHPALKPSQSHSHTLRHTH